MKLRVAALIVLCFSGTAVAKEPAKTTTSFRVSPYASALTSTGQSNFDGGFGGGLKLSFLGQNFGVETSLSQIWGSDSAIESVSAWEFGIIGALPLEKWTPYAVLGGGAYKPEIVNQPGVNSRSGMGFYVSAGFLLPLKGPLEFFGEAKYLHVAQDEHHLCSTSGPDPDVAYYTPCGAAGFDFDGLGLNLGLSWRF